MKQKRKVAFVVFSFLFSVYTYAIIPAKTPTEKECIQLLYQALQDCADYKNHTTTKSESCVINRVKGLEFRCCKDSENLCLLHEKVGNYALQKGNNEVAAIAYKFALMHCKQRLKIHNQG